MERDPNVFCIGEDIGVYGGAFKVSERLAQKFGEAGVIDAPISEIAMVGAAAGAAHMGLRPVLEMHFIDFIANAYDMLTNYVATARYRAFLPCPMVVRGPSGGYVRGGPFHSQNPEAAFVHAPGLKVVCPATAEDAKGLIKAAIRDDDCVLFFEHKYLYRRIKAGMPNGGHVVPIGKARPPGKGRTSRSSRTRRRFGKRWRPPSSSNARMASPWRSSTFARWRRWTTPRSTRRVEKTNCVLIVHEDTRTGGLAGEITARLNERCFSWLDAPVMRITAHDVALPYAPSLEDLVLPQTSDIVRGARWVLNY